MLKANRKVTVLPFSGSNKHFVEAADQEIAPYNIHIAHYPISRSHSSFKTYQPRKVQWSRCRGRVKEKTVLRHKSHNPPKLEIITIYHTANSGPWCQIPQDFTEILNTFCHMNDPWIIMKFKHGILQHKIRNKTTVPFVIPRKSKIKVCFSQKGKNRA